MCSALWNTTHGGIKTNNNNDKKSNMNQLDMQGRHAVVTGGANGLGFAIVTRMLESGAGVTLWDRDADALNKAANELRTRFGSAVINTDVVDVANHPDVARAAKALATTGVDIVVNSAGVAGPNMPLWEYPVDAWQQVMNVNINGTFNVCREVVPLMKPKNYGRIVNIASVAGKEGNPNASAYSASKAAVIGLTKSLGKELASSGIAVNCVTPAAVKTPIFSQMSPEHIQFMLSKIPMARFGLPDEIAAMVCWLCTEDCSFSTGAVFDMSGGRATY
jgi:2-dehydro-3-deoxy-L-rhamnonate dehydrogenase (NAD+)